MTRHDPISPTDCILVNLFDTPFFRFSALAFFIHPILTTACFASSSDDLHILPSFMTFSSSRFGTLPQSPLSLLSLALAAKAWQGPSS
jgi:hypothetical protein